MPAHINRALSGSHDSLDSIDLPDDAPARPAPFRAPSGPGARAGACVVSDKGLNATGLAFDPSQFLTLDDRFGLAPPEERAGGRLGILQPHALANATRMPLRAGDVRGEGPSVLQMQAPSMRSPQAIASFAAALIQEGVTDLFVCTRPGRVKPGRPGSAPPPVPTGAAAAPAPLLSGEPAPRPGRFSRLISRLLGRSGQVVRDRPAAAAAQRPAPPIQGGRLLHRPPANVGLDLKHRSTELLYGGGVADLRGTDGKRRWFQLAATPPLHEPLQRPFGPKAFVPPVTARAPGRLEVTYQDGDGRVHQRQVRLWNLEINRPNEWLPVLLRKSRDRVGEPPVRCAIACHDGARNSGKAVVGMQLLQMLRDAQEQHSQATLRPRLNGDAATPLRQRMLDALPERLADARARRSPLAACSMPGLTLEQLTSLTPLQAHEPLAPLVNAACRAWVGYTDNQQPLAKRLRSEEPLAEHADGAGAGRASVVVERPGNLRLASLSLAPSRSSGVSVDMSSPSSTASRRTSTVSAQSSTDSGLPSSLPRTPLAAGQPALSAWTGQTPQARQLRAFTHRVVQAYAGEPGDRVKERSRLLHQGLGSVLDALGPAGHAYSKTPSSFGPRLFDAFRIHLDHQWDHLDEPGRDRWLAAVTANDSSFAADLLAATTSLQTELNGMPGIDNPGADADIQDLKRDDLERALTREALLSVFREVAQTRQTSAGREQHVQGLTRL